MGRAEEGQKELQEFHKQETDAQEEINDLRDVLVSNRGASALVLSGQGEDAIGLFHKSIEAHPGASSLRLNLGIALDLLGRSREAAATLQDLLDRGTSDDFLVTNPLPAYEALNNGKNSQMYGAHTSKSMLHWKRNYSDTQCSGTRHCYVFSRPAGNAREVRQHRFRGEGRL
jgi:tetratricopeptide (TPR) repeat protein